MVYSNWNFFAIFVCLVIIALNGRWIVSMRIDLIFLTIDQFKAQKFRLQMLWLKQIHQKPKVSDRFRLFEFRIWFECFCIEKKNILGNGFASISPRIVGGFDAGDISTPYQCSIQSLIDGELLLVCGCAIISNEFVLTAAHCIILYEFQPFPPFLIRLVFQSFCYLIFE